MNEKIYKTMTHSGAAALTIGIIVAVVGITCGIISMAFGGHLLKKREQITF